MSTFWTTTGSISGVFSNDAATSEPFVDAIPAGLDQYLSSSEKRVAPVAGDSVGDVLNQLAVGAVERAAHGEIVKLVKQAVPQARCCKIGPKFFERIELLKQLLAPSGPGENAASFAEIMAAAWAYQILFGEEREHAKPTLAEQN